MLMSIQKSDIRALRQSRFGSLSLHVIEHESARTRTAQDPQHHLVVEELVGSTSHGAITGFNGVFARAAVCMHALSLIHI